MADRNEKEVTTDDATKRIKLDLDNRDYIPAILLSAIYVDIRSRTLIADHLRPDKDKWREIHSQLQEIRGSKARLSICENLSLISRQTTKNLKDLWDKRSDVAHNSWLWRNPTEKDKQEMERLCKAALIFLEQTRS